MNDLKLFIPITKVDEAQRLVYGVLADETPDNAKEIFDYDASKSYIEAWSEETSKNSGGKNLWMRPFPAETTPSLPILDANAA